jgi:hypothetical protein
MTQLTSDSTSTVISEHSRSHLSLQGCIQEQGGLPPETSTSSTDIVLKKCVLKPISGIESDLAGQQIFMIRLRQGTYQGTLDENGKPHGQKGLLLSKVSRYTGDFVHGRCHGMGVLEFVDGRRYEGQFVDGEQHGQGSCTFPGGGQYKGGWEHGLQQGQGTYVSSNGNHYEGEWNHGLCHGRGKFTSSEKGYCYEGEFVNNARHGWGKFHCITNGVTIQARYVNNRIQSDSFNLQDPPFLEWVVGGAGGVPQTDYSQGIVSDFLCRNGYPEIGHALKSAHFPSSIKEAAHESQKIYQKLLHSKSSLCVFNSIHHSMGLNMAPDHADPEFVIFEIFNSGEGLEEYHSYMQCEKNIKCYKKFQTMLQIKVPMKSITVETIKELIFGCSKQCKNAAGCYETVFNLSDAQEVPQSQTRATYQTQQKSGNCSLEWIFAWLKNKMPEIEYHRMRAKLFSACLLAIKDNPELMRKYGPELERKRDKRLEKIALLERSARASRSPAQPVCKLPDVGLLRLGFGEIMKRMRESPA